MRSLIIGMILLLAAAPSWAGSPPLPIDLVLSLRVASSTYADLRPGTTGILEFTVDSGRPGFVGFPFQISTLDFPTPVLLPLGDLQPIRLQAIAGDLCTLRTETSYLGEPGLWYQLEGFVPGSNMEHCHAAFDVLPAATARQILRFRVGPNSFPSFGYVELTPEDNFVDFGFGGTPAVPLAVGGKFGWLVLGAMLFGVVVRKSKRKRRVV